MKQKVEKPRGYWKLKKKDWLGKLNILNNMANNTVGNLRYNRRKYARGEEDMLGPSHLRSQAPRWMGEEAL